MRPHLRMIRAACRRMGWEPTRLSSDTVLVQRLDVPRNRAPDPLEAFQSDNNLRRILDDARIDRVLDVGAHRGGFGRRLRELGYHGEIVSFEPNADVFSELSAVATQDGAWTVHPAAMGDRPGTIRFNVARDSQFSSVHQRSKASEQFGDMMEPVRVEEVPVWTLDEFAARTSIAAGGRRLLLKVDTQGFDHAVFTGARKLLGQVQAVMFEAPVIAIYEGVPHYTETLRMLDEAAFGVYSFCPIARDATTGCIMEADVILRRRGAATGP